MIAISRDERTVSKRMMDEEDIPATTGRKENTMVPNFLLSSSKRAFSLSLS